MKATFKVLIKASFLFCLFSLFCVVKNYAQTVSSFFTVNKSEQCLDINEFYFTNKSIGANLTYHWDFGDTTYSSETNPKKVYTKAGVYNVTLTCTQNTVKYYYATQITVAPMPVVSFIDLQETFQGKSYTFISNSTIQFGSLKYYWNFGNNVGSSLVNPTHTYKDTGVYLVYLKAISNYGCIAFRSDSFKISVYDSSVFLPKFIVDNTNNCVNNPISFSYIGDTTNTTNFLWTFGDGTNSNLKNVVKQYTSSGNYFVKLSFDRNGISYSNENLITINNIDATFNIEVQADSATQILKPSNSNNNLQYNWSFGDGCISNLHTPSHVFYAGVYQVSLTVSNNSGCSQTSQQVVSVSNFPNNFLNASFNLTDSVLPLQNNLFSFSNTSSQGCNISYLWNFGDGTTSNALNPTKSFANLGEYLITLTVTANQTIKQFQRKVYVVNGSVWTGSFGSSWTDSRNWVASKMPSNNDDVTVPANSLHFPVIESNVIATLNNLTIDSNATIFIKGQIQVFGNLNNRSGLFSGKDGKISFVGSTTQKIYGTINCGDLIINNNAGVIFEGLNNDSVNIYNKLVLAKGLFNTNDRVVLKSNAKNTAKIDKVNENGNFGELDGEVTIETYFQNKRAWRFYTMPFTANGNNSRFTVNNTLQRQTNISGVTGNWFDYNTNYFSLNTWSDVTNRWANVTNTLTTFTVNNSTKFSNIPFYIFIRGNKTIGEDLQSTDLTFRFSGKLQFGEQQLNFSNKRRGNYVFVGNPYASPVDLATVQSNSQGLSGNYYYWDPTLNSNGAYVTISNKGNGVWITTPLAAQKGRFLQSTQAMLFEVSTSSGFVKFTESAKADSTYTDVFGSANNKMDKLTVNLYKVNKNGNKELVDGAITLFNSNYSKQVDELDSKKILNPQDNIGFLNGLDVLSIEARPFINGQDSLQIFTSNLSDSSQYAIELIADYTDTTVQQITLIDSSLKNKSNATFNGSTWYYFTTQSNASNAYGRFSVVVKSIKDDKNLVPALKVVKQQNEALISFKVDAEEGIKNYTIEYSVNGNNYISLTTLQAYNNNKTNNYTINHNLDAFNGKIFYRVKATKFNDIILYSNIEMIEKQTIPLVNENWYVYPNPTKNNFNLHIFSATNQNIQVQLIEPILGKILSTQFYKLNKGENIIADKFSNYNYISNGLYYLNVLTDSGENRIFKIVKTK